jgi:5-amino-6-(5-phosphoribosylamino)uracil reductase
MVDQVLCQRPRTTVVLALSADGKIADQRRSHPRFGSAQDYAHLEQQVAAADGVLFGAATLRAGGTAMRVLQPDLIQQRLQAGKPAQPVQIVCSRSANFDPDLPFFRQPVSRWLITGTTAAQPWQHQPGFEHILSPELGNGEIDWPAAMQTFTALGIADLVVLGGGKLIAALLQENLIDELWLTICPILLGGTTAPTPVAGEGFWEATAPRLELLAVRPIDQEVFLHYRVLHPPSQEISPPQV